MSTHADAELAQSVTRDDLNAAVAKLEGELNAALEKIAVLTSKVFVLTGGLHMLEKMHDPLDPAYCS